MELHVSLVGKFKKLISLSKQNRQFCMKCDWKKLSYKKIHMRCIFRFCFEFSSFSFQKVDFLMKNSQMLNQFHKRDFLGYAFNFSLKFVFLSIGQVKCLHQIHKTYTCRLCFIVAFGNAFLWIKTAKRYT